MNIILFENKPNFIPRTDQRALHIRKILKLETGESFRAGIIDGPVGIVTILGHDEKGYTVEWQETGPPVEPYPLTLIAGFVRPISAKRILREAASLGVGRLVFTVTDTGEKSYLEANLWKSGEYRDYLINGLQTAGATKLPLVDLCRDVREAVSAGLEGALFQSMQGDNDPVRLLLDNKGDGAGIAEKNLRDRPVVIAVGSERGWSDRERELFLQAHFEPVRIGSRIVRTETACTAGAVLALQGMGRL